MEYLSDHLRVLRAAQGKTQHYMATLIHKNQGSYSRIERGIDQLTIEELAIIAKEFKMEPHELLEKAKQPPFPQNK